MNKSRWEDLFAETAGGPAQTVTLRLLRKAGEPLLLLPADPAMAGTALSLYPAQRPRARWAKGTLRRATAIGLPPSREKTRLTVWVRGPFVRFLARQVRRRSAGVVSFDLRRTTLP